MAGSDLLREVKTFLACPVLFSLGLSDLHEECGRAQFGVAKSQDEDYHDDT